MTARARTGRHRRRPFAFAISALRRAPQRSADRSDENFAKQPSTRLPSPRAAASVVLAGPIRGGVPFGWRRRRHAKTIDAPGGDDLRRPDNGCLQSVDPCEESALSERPRTIPMPSLEPVNGPTVTRPRDLLRTGLKKSSENPQLVEKKNDMTSRTSCLRIDVSLRS